jgi:acetyl-CoA carboxylase carboxyltransferase component
MPKGRENPAEPVWQPELDELRRREELAHQMGGEERIARARAAGRLTVRERIALLLDPDTSRNTAPSPASRHTTATA